MELVELVSVSPGIVQEIIYATEHNFLKRVLYSSPRCLLQKSVAERLHRVQMGLKKRGLGLKIFDAYRPLSVQKLLWEVLPDTRYVADPALGSKHNRGAAVDVTLIDPEGRELPMPTEVDVFSNKAHRDYMAGPKNLLDNRQLLEDAMVGEGFIPLPTEWWHFDDPEWKTFPILDIPL